MDAESMCDHYRTAREGCPAGCFRSRSIPHRVVRALLWRLAEWVLAGAPSGSRRENWADAMLNRLWMDENVANGKSSGSGSRDA